eukprot:TRINITY_DN38296_c1_g1_i2.p2 TRINITY_DN38296_c1_g1~~TRINITY_DN38296_c1_g1_i2.p2  ORF type:complete len:174 (+),score=37.58 TRINITY_DN38296_c1_g1_i2:25-546(+)
MPKYSVKADPEKTSKTKGSDLTVHFKNTRETANAIRGMKLSRAKDYLNRVLKKKEAIPFRIHTGGVGHHSAGNSFKYPKVRWPQNAVKLVLSLLQNAEANANVKGLKSESLIVSHVMVNRARKQRRRTYRAHGRINAFMRSPCHIELILAEKKKPVPRGPSKLKAPKERKKKL